MSSQARSSNARQPDWYLHDGEAEIGPLIEVEVRKRLASATKGELERMRVRQGSSDWHPAALVLARFKELAQNGVYLKLDEITHGPFTPERAAQVLRTDMPCVGRLGDPLATVGRQGDWTLAGSFLSSLDQLMAANKQSQSQSEEDETPLAKAILIEEPMAPLLEEVSSPKPVALYKASLVVEEPKAIPVVARPEPQPAPAAVGPPPVYPRPIIKPTPKAKLKQSGGGSPWMIWAAAGVFAFLIFGGGLVWFLTRGGSATTADVGDSRDVVAGGESEAAVPLSSDNAPPRPPVVTVGMLFRPEFRTTMGPVNAGTAFAARLPGSERPIIVSALHLFGPSGGMDQDVPANRLPAVWTGLSLLDCVTQRNLGQRPGRALLMAGAKPYPEQSAVGDVVAYLPDMIDGLKTFKLSEQTPREGERVWLVSEIISGPGLVHAATVEGTDQGYLVYRFDDPSLEIVATSGAPVVNAKHEVIAVNAAGGQINGSNYGIGTPTYKFFEPLAQAAGLR